ncbi:MAG: NAD(P)-binding protein [Acidimicrobiales bacterium]
MNRPRRGGRTEWLVVGAGFSGATLAERLATQLGARVLVVDRRPHLAGNAFDEIDSTGVRVHRYGAHIFHTKSEEVWR